ncbi:DUF2213 domain-containing protein [Sphingobium sp. WW5]|uniref:DUF2213 domain-containing protein n=1 Tax=unclassified Sphingobium TaxID=2611147 RepID=UPI003C226A2B
MVLFSDALTLDAPRRTSDGYMAVRAKAARTGTYAYLGSEIDPDNKHGLRDAGMVNVLRDAEAVFDPLSAHSFIGKPITDNHPTVAVNAKNWRDHARGTVMGAKWEEGGYLAFDLMLTDADTIDAVDAGKRELSNGYAAELQFGDFDGPGGVKCVAKQVAIKGNHVAIVDRGRAGPSCAITDSVAICDANPAFLADLTPPLEKPAMKIRIGDAEVDATNGEAVRIANDAREGAFKELQTKVGTLTADLATANTTIQTKDGEIVALTAKLADAEVTPAKLQQLADARADVIAKAKILAPTLATDGKTDAEIRKAAVTAKLGDAAKDMADAAIEGAFIAFTKDAKPADPLRQVLADGAITFANDAASQEGAAYQRMVDRLTGKKTA